MSDISQTLQSQLERAVATNTPLCVVGGDSKAFFGRASEGEPLCTSAHRGVVHYAPTELVLTARCGTPLSEITHLLAEHGQMLPFEPPAFGDAATIGGTIACGLSGPRRPYAGASRDFVLGTTILSGDGQILRFGGEVMKNVAGYDVSRLMCGALGTLGVLLDVSLKVLPRPAYDASLRLEMSAAEAIDAMNRWASQPLPLSGACHDGGAVILRLSGSEESVRGAMAKLGGEPLAEGDSFWSDLREQTLAFFDSDSPLWRLCVPSTVAPLELPGKWLLDWGGGQRWLKTPANESTVRDAAASAGGHATLFRGGDRSGDVFQKLEPQLAKLHRALKLRFDPTGILNPGRMYPQW